MPQLVKVGVLYKKAGGYLCIYVSTAVLLAVVPSVALSLLTRSNLYLRHQLARCDLSNTAKVANVNIVCRYIRCQREQTHSV